MIVCISHAKVGYRQTIFSNEKPDLERGRAFSLALPEALCALPDSLADHGIRATALSGAR